MPIDSWPREFAAAGNLLERAAMFAVSLNRSEWEFAVEIGELQALGLSRVDLRVAWIGWLAVTFVVTSLYLGALLRLPRWLIDLSPVGRTTAPSHYSIGALTVMVVVAAALTVLAGWIYRSRDAI